MAEQPRLFTVVEANRALALVRPIVRDLLSEHQAWRKEIERFDAAVATAPLEQDEEGVAYQNEAANEAHAAAGEHAARIDALLTELQAIGCLFKGFDSGLVDFLSLRDDQPVYLCWRYGEPGVTHWHPIDGGFAGRQAIDHHLLTETT